MRRVRYSHLPYKNDIPIYWKAYIAMIISVFGLYNNDTNAWIQARVNESYSKGGGADWPTYYISLQEVHTGRRSLDAVVKTWDKVRDVHQRDWLLPLLSARALDAFVMNPPVLESEVPSEYIVNRLVEQLEFSEGDVTRMSAEIAVHINNLLVGNVKWPGRMPNSSVLAELEDMREKMAEFTIHPVLQERLNAKHQEPQMFYGGGGYFTTTSEEMMEQSSGPTDHTIISAQAQGHIASSKSWGGYKPILMT